MGFTTVSAQGSPAEAVKHPPARHTIHMFAPAQYDSVLSLIQGNDSLKYGADLIGVGIDTLNNDIIVVAFDQKGNPSKFVFPDSSLKKKTAQTAAAPKTARKPDQRGRTWFIIESALKSAYVYPVSYAAAFNHAGGSVIGGISLLTIGGSLYGTFAFTRNMDLGYGRVGLMNYGSTFLGLHYPHLFASLLKNATSINDRSTNDSTDDVTTTDKIKAWSSMIGFPLGIYLGSKLRVACKDDAGKVTLMEYFSQPTGYLLGYLLPMYFLNPDDDTKDYLAVSALLTMGLLPAGFWAGHAIAGDRPISTGRGSLPYVSGIMGGLTGLIIPTWFEPHMELMSMVRLLATTTIIGYGCGTALGLTYHRSEEYTYWQTVFIGASSGAGALMAIAFPLIAKADQHQPYTIAGVIGAWAGFFIGERLSLSLFEKSSRDRQSSNLRFNLPGLAALPSLMAPRRPDASKICLSKTGPLLPVANVEWKF
jgi:hypothetical protein